MVLDVLKYIPVGSSIDDLPDINDYPLAVALAAEAGHAGPEAWSTVADLLDEIYVAVTGAYSKSSSKKKATSADQKLIVRQLVALIDTPLGRETFGDAQAKNKRRDLGPALVCLIAMRFVSISIGPVGPYTSSTRPRLLYHTFFGRIRLNHSITLSYALKENHHRVRLELEEDLLAFEGVRSGPLAEHQFSYPTARTWGWPDRLSIYLGPYHLYTIDQKRAYVGRRQLEVDGGIAIRELIKSIVKIGSLDTKGGTLVQPVADAAETLINVSLVLLSIINHDHSNSILDGFHSLFRRLHTRIECVLRCHQSFPLPRCLSSPRLLTLRHTAPPGSRNFGRPFR